MSGLDKQLTDMVLALERGLSVDGEAAAATIREARDRLRERPAEPPSGLMYPALIDISTVPTSIPPTSMPSFGESFSEPYGTVVSRITEEDNEFQHYGKNRAITLDGQLLALGLNRLRDARPPFGVRQAIADGSSRARRRLSNVDPDLIYATGDGSHLARLVRYRISDSSIAPIVDYAGKFGRVDIGRGEGNLSDDDRWVVLVGSPDTGANYTHAMLVEISAGSEVSRRPVSELDWISSSHSGTWIVARLASDKSMWIWPREGFGTQEPKKLDQPALSHPDFVIDAAGREYIVGIHNAGRSVAGLRLPDGALTTYLQWPTKLSGHVSGRAFKRPGGGYAYVSTRKHSAGARDVVCAVRVDEVQSPMCEVWCSTREAAGDESKNEPAATVSAYGDAVVYRSRMGGPTLHSFLCRMPEVIEGAAQR